MGLVFGTDVGRVPGWTIGLSSLGVLLSIVAAMVALLNRRYLVAPEPALVARTASSSEDLLRWLLLGNVLEAITTNRLRLRRKAAVLTAAQASLLVAIVIFGGYWLVSRLTGGG